MRIALTIGCLLMGVTLSAQQSTFGYQEFMEQLANHHPVVKQSGLRVAISDANERLQRSVMDPYVALDYGDKSYDDKAYYQKSSFKFALPTAYGLEVFAGYAENIGPQVDPEILTSNSGQYQAGISLPIGTDILYNERRLAIRQAALMVDMAESDRRIMVNDLFFRASLAYLNWSLADAYVGVQEEALQLAQEQFEFVRQVYLGGDRAAIDTTEAFLQVQLRQFQLLEAQRQLNGAKILLENFLWDPEGTPVGLADALRPQALEDFDPFVSAIADSVLTWQEQLLANHPQLTLTRLQIESLELERQTAFSGALPQLDFKYAVLSPGVSDRDIQALGINDRMLGVGLKYPLLIRKQRSKLSLVSLKTQDKQLELNTKSVGLNTKLDQQVMEYGIHTEQSILYTQMVANYERLLQAERVNFSMGEGSVFLLNARENKLFDAQVKQLETKAKQIGSIFKLIQTANREESYLRALGSQ